MGWRKRRRRRRRERQERSEFCRKRQAPGKATKAFLMAGNANEREECRRKEREAEAGTRQTKVM